MGRTDRLRHRRRSWRSPARNDQRHGIDAANPANLRPFTAATMENACKDQRFVDAAKLRIDAREQDRPRRYEDLREEERIVVYRG